MKKVILALTLVVLIVCASVMMFACNKSDEYVYKTQKEAYTYAELSSLKVGAIMVGDETEGYTKAHMDGINAAKAAVEAATGKTIEIVWKKKVDETAACATACEEAIAEGAKLIITNSYGHEFPIRDVIYENPQVMFVSMTGDLAAVSGWSNWKNAFTNIYEARYVSGCIAGLKLKKLIEDGKIAATNKDANGNVKIGYVGAYPYAEVVSGYTAFYLGVKHVVDNVVMTVQYTNSWFDFDAEKQTAASLISDGCVIIGQHADSEGAPTACQEARTAGKEVYSVGYNVSMLTAAPDAALTSASNNWDVYYTYLFTQMLAGKEVATDWSKGYTSLAVDNSAVGCTPLGTAAVTGSVTYATAIKEAIVGGSKVFDCERFTVGGQHLTTYTGAYGMNGAECIKSYDKADGTKGYYFDESTLRSAPYFDLRIDGITEITKE